MTNVRPGGFYGWPWSYWGRHVDERVEPARPDMVARAIQPAYALGPQTGSLGLTFADGARLGPSFASGTLVGQHGLRNRNRTRDHTSEHLAPMRDSFVGLCLET